MKARFKLFLGTLVVIGMTQTASAIDYTWNGTTNGTWDTTGTNWTGTPTDPWNSTNGLANKAILNLASLNASVSGTVYTNGITFSTTGALGGGIINLAGTAPTISVAASQTGTIGSVLSGAAGLAKANTGTLILSGANDYTGGTAINAGTLQINTGGTLGSTSGALSMGTGSPGVIGTVGNLTVNTNTQVGAMSVQSNTSTVLTTNIGQLSIANGKTLTTSSLAVGVSQGATSNAINTALGTGSSNAGTLTVIGDVTVGLSTGGSGSQAITVADLSGLANFNAGSGVGNFRVGYGNLNRATLTLASTANVINVATISVGETTSNGNSSQNNILNLGTGTNSLQANTVVTGTQKASGVIQFSHATNGSVTITGAGGTGVSNIFVGNSTGTGSYQAGSLNNRLLLAGHTANVSAGTVTVARRTGASGGNAVIADLTFDTGNFTTTGNVTLAQIAAVAAGSGVTGVFTLGTSSSSTGELTVGTSGTPRDFVLADNRMTTNNFAANGSLVINGGTATIHGNITDTSTTTTGSSTTTLTLNGGTLDMTNGNIGGDGTSGNRAITNLNFQSGTLKNVAQINGGNTGLTKTTAGTLVLVGANSYTGATLISQGTLQIGEGSTTGTLSTSSTITNNGTLAFRRSNTITQGTNFASGIGGTGGIALKSTSSAGVVVLGGTNTFEGGIAITSGVLKITNSAALGTGVKQVTLTGGGGEAANLGFQLDGTGGDITLSSDISFLASSNSGAGIRNIAGNNEIQGSIGLNTGLANSTIGSDAGTLTVSGNISTTNSGRTLQLNGASTAANTVSGSISDGTGNVSLSKAGEGTWILSNANNSYTGATTVTAGKLVVNGNISTSNTTVKDTAILGGGGTVGGVLVEAGGKFAPGNSPGTMTFAGDLTLSLDSISDFEINAFTSGNYDLALAQALGTQTATFSGGILNLLFQSGFSTSGTVKIFDFDSYAGTGFNTVNVTGLADGYTATFNSTNGIVTVIPEPNAAALVGGLGVLALLRRRRA